MKKIKSKLKNIKENIIIEEDNQENQSDKELEFLFESQLSNYQKLKQIIKIIKILIIKITI